MGKMKEIRVYNIAPDLHKQFKTACAESGLHMNQVFIGFMRIMISDVEYLMPRINKPEEITKKGGKKV